MGLKEPSNRPIHFTAGSGKCVRDRKTLTRVLPEWPSFTTRYQACYGVLVNAVPSLPSNFHANCFSKSSFFHLIDLQRGFSVSVVRERLKLRDPKRLFLFTLNKEPSVWIIVPKHKFLPRIPVLALNFFPTVDLVSGDINTTWCGVFFLLLLFAKIKITKVTFLGWQNDNGNEWNVVKEAELFLQKTSAKQGLSWTWISDFSFGS